MSNFNNQEERDTQIKNLPRLTFQLPQSTTGQQQGNILMCQTGCDLQFNFNNINSVKVDNADNLFTITPNDNNSENYINWNGTGKDGMNSIRFDLKEIYFQAPAKDVIGQLTYNKSIQYFFTFVNEKYNNIMITISVIGQANNVGNEPETNGFVLMRELANQIPTRNEEADLNNLSQFNLGNLLPANKSFFSTLVNNGTVQYISMSNIVDVPIEFFNNFISRVIGSTIGYRQRVSNYVQNIPSNPAGTIIFYNENVELVGAGQKFGCNANCQRVPVNNQETPKIGDRTTGSGKEGRVAKSRARMAEEGDLFAEEEECEEEEMWPGSYTDIDIKKKKSLEAGNIVYIIFLVFVMLGSIPLMFMALYWKFGLTSVRDIFSNLFWNKYNVLWIFLGLFAISIIIICYAIEIGIYQEQMKKEQTNKKPWIALIVGSIVYSVILFVIFYMAHKGDTKFYNESPFMGDMGNLELKKIKLSSPFGINSPNYKLTSSLSTLGKNPNLLNTSEGLKLYNEAKTSFNKLPSNQKKIIDATLGDQFFRPGSTFSKSIKTGEVNNAVKSAVKTGINKYQRLLEVGPKLKTSILDLSNLEPGNMDLQKLADMVKTNNTLTMDGLQLLLEIGKRKKI